MYGMFKPIIWRTDCKECLSVSSKEQSLTFQNPEKIGPKRIDIVINVKEVTFVQEAL